MLSSLIAHLLLGNHFIYGMAELYSGYQSAILALALLMSLIVSTVLAVFPVNLGEDDEYFLHSGHLEFFVRASF